VTSRALSLEDISVTYRRPTGGERAASVTALSSVSLDVGAGECVGVVGESGSGKSTIAQVVVGLVRPQRGRVTLGDRPAPSDPRLRPLAMRREVQLVPQDPYGSLNPMQSIAAIVAEGLAIHRLCPSNERRARAAAALNEVGLDEAYLDRRPHELSGGQRQRVAIARALAVEPRLLVLDEPTSALDLIVQAQVLNLLLTIQQRRGLSYLMISHDIDVVRHVANRVYVLKGGAVVEAGETEEVLRRPKDPYTKKLIDAVPTLEVMP
jgi:ABC-type glutathione transport system ATPase component